MSPFFLGMMIGAAGGIFITTYALAPSFRDRLNSSVGGFLGGAVSGKKQKKKQATTTQSSPKPTNGKTHQCMACGRDGNDATMEEVSIRGSRAKAWIHRVCMPGNEEA